MLLVFFKYFIRVLVNQIRRELVAFAEVEVRVLTEKYSSSKRREGDLQEGFATVHQGIVHAVVNSLLTLFIDPGEVSVLLLAE
jgi:hypothetical protein